MIYYLLLFFSAAAEGHQRRWRGSPGLLSLLPLLVFYHPRFFIFFLLFLGQLRLPPSPSPSASSLTPTCSPCSSAPSPPHPRSLYPTLPPPAINGWGISSGRRASGSPGNRFRRSISGPGHPSAENPERVCSPSCYVSARSSKSCPGTPPTSSPWPSPCPPLVLPPSVPESCFRPPASPAYRCSYSSSHLGFFVWWQP